MTQGKKARKMISDDITQAFVPPTISVQNSATQFDDINQSYNNSPTRDRGYASSIGSDNNKMEQVMLSNPNFAQNTILSSFQVEMNKSPSASNEKKFESNENS
jgi:hypothetical protein